MVDRSDSYERSPDSASEALGIALKSCRKIVNSYRDKLRPPAEAGEVSPESLSANPPGALDGRE
jgi:hypothetical protein